MSMSTPASTDLTAASAPSTAVPCATVSRIEVQSLTTKPLNRHSLCKIWPRVNGLADAGTPLRALKRAHHRGRTVFEAGPERRQVDVAQQALRDLGGVVIAPALGRTIADEVLEAGEQ